MLLLMGNSLSDSLRQHFTARAAVPGRGLITIPSTFDLFHSTEPGPELFSQNRKSLPDFADNQSRLAGRTVTILQSMTAPVAESAMNLLLGIRTLKRHRAGTVIVAMPRGAFDRQDRPFEGHFCSLGADDFPVMLKEAGADKIITSEVHSKAAEGFYIKHFGVDNVAFLSSTPLFNADLLENIVSPVDVVIGAPDGANKPNDAGQLRAYDLTRTFWDAATLSAVDMRAKMFRIIKEHTGVNETRCKLTRDSNVSGKMAVLVDDMSDTCGTLINSGKELKSHGAASVWAYLTHALFNEKALNKMLSAVTPDGAFAVDRVVITDTVPGQEEKIAALERDYPGASGRVTVLSVASQYEQQILSL
jgi:ribose-phosphate pyrophosphokinase